MQCDNSQREEVIHRLSGTGQDHLLEILKTGSPAEQLSLVQQISTELSNVDFHHLNHVLIDSLSALNDHSVGNSAVIEPPPEGFAFDLPAERQTNPGHVAQLEADGYKAIHEGRLAFLILAGGSGTRLGLEIPKGLFTCNGMRQKKSLFQVHCEKIRYREEIATARHNGVPSAKIPLLIMTSSQNDKQTKEFFEENKYFGLSPDQVYFFRQVSLPCYNEKNGQILLEAPGRICLSPGGNGGLYSAITALQGNGESVLQRMRRIGIQYIQIGNVDNLLTQVADPLFFAYALESCVHVAVKSSPKVAAEERVGVFARIDGLWGVVEYTEIGTERASMRHQVTGELKFNHANISCYLCSTDILEAAAEYLKTFTHYHAARKMISTVHGNVMGVKLEAFIFDLFRLSKDCLVKSGKSDFADGFRILLVDRNDEFAPIKNAEGASSDTALDSARLARALHRRWLLTALRKMGTNEADAAAVILEKGDISVEISPRVSSAGEGLESYIQKIVQQILHERCDEIVVEKEDGIQI